VPVFALITASLIGACAGGDGPEATGDTAAAPSVATGTPAAGSGEQLYQRCVTCHQANGQGVPGAFPPLAGSEFATAANPAVPIRVVLHGMQGPVTVGGQQFSGMMPQYGTGIAMTDQEVAAVLTYVRQSFGNNASAITPEQVAAERAAQRTATGPVTAEELHAMMGTQ
jgi:mono/diheme cytochrome c family protein